MRTDNNQKKSGRIVFISCLCIGFLIIIFGLSQSSKKQVPLSNSQLTNENKSTTSIVTTALNNALTTVSPNNKTVSNSVTNSSIKNT
ncbi:MAG: hypothetical protein Q4G00_16080, partial [Clostridia bacterium]|nr:hypothetical protein [Clostridia bacterium]